MFVGEITQNQLFQLTSRFMSVCPAQIVQNWKKGESISNQTEENRTRVHLQMNRDSCSRAVASNPFLGHGLV